MMSKQSNHSFGGLKVRNGNDIAITLICEICKLLLLHPMQLLCCGTRLCKWCSKKGLPDSEPFICPFCNSQQSKKQVLSDRGVERELNTINIDCHLCSWNGSYKDYKEHLQQYHADLECIDCGERFYAINSYEEHREEICESRYILCGLPGCMELVKRPEMSTHYLCDEHQKMLLEFVVHFYLKVSLYSNNQVTTSLNITSKMQEELINVTKSIDILQPAIQTLSNDSERLKTEYDQTKLSADAICVQINEERKNLNVISEKIHQHEKLQSETEKEVENTKILYSLSKIPVLDDDGTRTFYFSQTNDELKSAFSIFSSIFKTATFGYPFVLRLCSTIQSTNQNQPHLSIYISLLRGDYDAILFYPFPYNIYLCLCDQSGQKKHIISTIEPNSNTSLFSRPTSERNDEVGIVKFCPLSYLTDDGSIYLKDGIFFLRIFFDFMNTNQSPFI